MRENMPPMIWREVGRRVRNFRRAQGRSVDWLAAAAGVHRVQIIRIEAGPVGTTLERLARIAEALQVSIGDLVSSPAVADGATIESVLAARVYAGGDPEGGGVRRVGRKSP